MWLDISSPWGIARCERIIVWLAPRWKWSGGFTRTTFTEVCIFSTCTNTTNTYVYDRVCIYLYMIVLDISNLCSYANTICTYMCTYMYICVPVWTYMCTSPEISCINIHARTHAHISTCSCYVMSKAINQQPS